MPRHTTEEQDRIIEFLSKNGPSTVAQISDALGMDYREVNPSIMRLEGKRIRRAGRSSPKDRGRRLWAVIR